MLCDAVHASSSSSLRPAQAPATAKVTFIAAAVSLPAQPTQLSHTRLGRSRAQHWSTIIAHGSTDAEYGGNFSAHAQMDMRIAAPHQRSSGAGPPELWLCVH